MIERRGARGDTDVEHTQVRGVQEALVAGFFSHRRRRLTEQHR